MQSNQDTTVTSYNTTAQEYHEKTKNLPMEAETKEFLPRVSKEGLVLDLGCGAGRESEKFTQSGLTVIGLDPAEELIKIAKQNSPNTAFSVGYAQNLPFENETFNGIWACASLIHIPKKDLSITLKEIYRTMKPGAIFYADFKQDEENLREETIKDSRYGGVKKFFSFYQKSEINKELKGANFNILKVWGKDIDNPYATNTWMSFISSKPKT
ncbi:class I SAM-dependent methyltransferase [Methanococcoides sp. SA1]|nr:class I SAM-dependent methyltransferase [Methanococcoides sp. SA1]